MTALQEAPQGQARRGHSPTGKRSLRHPTPVVVMSTRLETQRIVPGSNRAPDEEGARNIRTYLDRSRRSDERRHRRRLRGIRDRPASPKGAGLDAMVLPELKQLASSLGLKGTGAMRKGQLIDAIKTAQGGQNSSSGATAPPRTNGDHPPREQTANSDVAAALNNLQQQAPREVNERREESQPVVREDRNGNQNQPALSGDAERSEGRSQRSAERPARPPQQPRPVPEPRQPEPRQPEPGSRQPKPRQSRPGQPESRQPEPGQPGPGTRQSESRNQGRD